MKILLIKIVLLAALFIEELFWEKGKEKEKGKLG
jgi:hypothetical protein